MHSNTKFSIHLITSGLTSLANEIEGLYVGPEYSQKYH